MSRHPPCRLSVLVPAWCSRQKWRCFFQVVLLFKKITEWKSTGKNLFLFSAHRKTKRTSLTTSCRSYHMEPSPHWQRRWSGHVFSGHRHLPEPQKIPVPCFRDGLTWMHVPSPILSIWWGPLPASLPRNRCAPKMRLSNQLQTLLAQIRRNFSQINP